MQAHARKKEPSGGRAAYDENMETKTEKGSVRLLAPLYAGRKGILRAALQYVYQAVRLGKGEEAAAFAALAGVKFRDFERLGALLLELGADPVFTACPPYPVSYFSCAGVDYAKSLPAMLSSDLAMEEGLSEEIFAAAEALPAHRSALAEMGAHCLSAKETLSGLGALT